MKNLIQFATRIDKDLKEKVMEFSKEKNVSVQKIVEFSLKKTLSNPDNNKSSITIFASDQLEKANRRSESAASELLSEIEFFCIINNISFDKKINEMFQEYNKLLIEEEKALEFYQESLKY